jgi:hypothetical protein
MLGDMALDRWCGNPADLQEALAFTHALPFGYADLDDEYGCNDLDP